MPEEKNRQMNPILKKYCVEDKAVAYQQMGENYQQRRRQFLNLKKVWNIPIE